MRTITSGVYEVDGLYMEPGPFARTRLSDDELEREFALHADEALEWAEQVSAPAAEAWPSA